ncbi:hypothetical protein [Nocardioides sp. URHA0020]|uniref:hypothetical protein n=1 Tax=Nocardioides sp. URHA0020 TaxID=1380392 RepID=UPI000AAAFBEB|nr:hypothetical protein [Nocardioides sp. URHA0020]
MRRLLAGGTGLLVLMAGLVAVQPTSYAGAGPARVAVRSDHRIVVSWKGEHKRRVYQKSVNVPGIGTVDLTCRPRSTQIQIRPASRAPETQMWLAKFEDKQGRDVVSVKNVRVYTYATAADDGRGGTGPRAHEGLNQQSRIEDFQKGYAYGLVSQRPSRSQPGRGALTTPATSFELTWWWERFRHPGHQYCRMALTLHTDTARQFGLSWHGTAEGDVRSTSTTTIPGLGDAVVTCEPGAVGDQTVAFRPRGANQAAARLYYRVIEGEGDVDDQVTTASLGRDPDTGLLGPVELPRNGMMMLWATVNGVKRGYVLSSYYIVNNKLRPELNSCEVAATPLP